MEMLVKTCPEMAKINFNCLENVTMFAVVREHNHEPNHNKVVKNYFKIYVIQL